MSTAIVTPAESSPAPAVPVTPEPTTLVAPERGEAREKWLRGEEFTPKADPAPAKESSAEGKKPEEKTAPASEPGDKQDRQRPNKAEARANELKTILDEFKELGFTPAQLREFTAEWKSRPATEKAEKAEKTATERTEKPVETGLKPPVKPKAEDFEGKSWAEYEAAKDQYLEDLADYKAQKRLEEFQQRQREEASTRELLAKVSDAEKRYGADAREVIRDASTEIFNDKGVDGVVKALLNDSPVLVDVLYTLGSDAKSMADFLGDAKANPGAAIRKLVLVEKLVMEELGSGKAEAKPADRDENGKFKATEPPKKTTAAPPPPVEVGGTAAQPPDEVEQAFKRGDARAFIEAENRRELRRRKGL